MTELVAPDFLGTTARVQDAANVIENAQAQITSLENVRIANGLELADRAVIGTDKDTGETVLGPVYQEYYAKLRAGIQAVMEECAKEPSILDELNAEALKRRKARERFFENDDRTSRYRPS